MRDKLCLSNMIINSLTLHMSLMKGLCKNNKKLKEINDAKKKKKFLLLKAPYLLTILHPYQVKLYC